jgi:hypothetical protein
MAKCIWKSARQTLGTVHNITYSDDEMPCMGFCYAVLLLATGTYELSDFGGLDHGADRCNTPGPLFPEQGLIATFPIPRMRFSYFAGMKRDSLVIRSDIFPALSTVGTNSPVVVLTKLRPVARQPNRRVDVRIAPSRA